ncbi:MULTISPECIES: DUF1146 family protein [Dellaglioa]|nr:MULTISPECIES: DUF1146 family protein [Dellaglioa]MCZ2490690.1 DUF1146 family protein [Dellaglioa carnosa]MCZ2492319.1 DUF1146 family protein [Dellaglioa carnosa]MCZ2493768.1 DUF1146 family protein [Dellaglioa carnosa]MDK1716837.1 DUF1146 family protein [Dellaglioa algida]MDK1719200.1 DUF1146 family protein [Dellaglioa algida]
MNTVGIQSLVTLMSHLMFIGIAFWAIQGLRIDRFFPQSNQQRIKALIVMLAILLGYTSSAFFLNFMDNIRNLVFLVK